MVSAASWPDKVSASTFSGLPQPGMAAVSAARKTPTTHQVVTLLWTASDFMDAWEHHACQKTWVSYRECCVRRFTGLRCGARSRTMMRLLRRISLTQWIVISMIAGVAIGAVFPEQSQNLKVLSNIFLKLIKCIIVPIIVSTLVVGIAGHSDDLKAVGRLAFKSLIYFEIVTTLALAIGLLAVNLVKPGVGVVLPPPAASSGAPPPE